MEKFLDQAGWWVDLWGIVLAVDLSRKTQPTLGDTIPPFHIPPFRRFGLELCNSKENKPAGKQGGCMGLVLAPLSCIFYTNN